jgi:hypothetical protein
MQLRVVVYACNLREIEFGESELGYIQIPCLKQNKTTITQQLVHQLSCGGIWCVAVDADSCASQMSV